MGDDTGLLALLHALLELLLDLVFNGILFVLFLHRCVLVILALYVRNGERLVRRGDFQESFRRWLIDFLLLNHLLIC